MSKANSAIWLAQLIRVQRVLLERVVGRVRRRFSDGDGASRRLPRHVRRHQHLTALLDAPLVDEQRLAPRVLQPKGAAEVDGLSALGDLGRNRHRLALAHCWR